MRRAHTNAHFSSLLFTMSQVRGLASGVAATANWAANAAVSQTFLALTAALGGSGAFWLYAGVAAAGAAWVFIALPETKGVRSCRRSQGVGCRYLGFVMSRKCCNTLEVIPDHARLYRK